MHLSLRLPNLAILVFIFVLIRTAILVPFYGQIGQPLVLSHLHYSLLGLAVVLIAAAGYLVNDLYDVEIDRINRPGKNPIGNGFAPKTAWLVYAILNIAGMAITVFLMHTTFILIHLLVIFGLWFYSFWLKKQALLGNILVAVLAALAVVEPWFLDLPVFYAQIAAKSIPAQESLFLLMMYAGFAFLTTFFREVIKDIEDVEGDKKNRCQTLPIIWGIARTTSLCLGVVAAIAMAIWLQTRMLWNGGHSIAALYSVIALLLPLLFLIFRLRNAKKKADYSQLSFYLKIYMLLGLLLLPIFALT